jgi:hypothetical protein
MADVISIKRKRLGDMAMGGGKAFSGTTPLPPVTFNEKESEKMSTKSQVIDTAKVEVLEHGTIIGGHLLKAGTILEMSAEDIDLHRDHGIRLGPVRDDDKRATFDHTQEPMGASEDKPLKHVGHDN